MPERYRYTLSTLTPVHIGTGETMLPMEFEISEDYMQMWVPELEQTFLKYPNAAKQFTDNLTKLEKNGFGKTTIGSLLGKVDFKDTSILKYSTRNPQQFNYGYNGLKHLKEQIDKSRQSPEVRLATKTPDYRVYIPGSSIKGSLKTAWAYDVCKDNLNLINDVAKNRKDKEAHHRIQSIFQGLKDEANYDLFRVLQVGDSEPREASEVLYVTGVKVLSAALSPQKKDVEAKWKNYWIFCEAIAHETKHTGYLTLQTELLTDPKAKNELGWKDKQQTFSLNALCKSVNRFALEICNWEIDYFQKIKQVTKQCEFNNVLNNYYISYLKKHIEKVPEHTCYLSIGYGSGWHKMTIGMLLEKQLSQKDFIKLRENLRLADKHTAFEYPKSRKLVMLQEHKATYPFGWVKLQFERV